MYTRMGSDAVVPRSPSLGRRLNVRGPHFGAACSKKPLLSIRPAVAGYHRCVNSSVMAMTFLAASAMFQFRSMAILRKAL